MKAVAPRGWGTPPPRRPQGWVRITSPSEPKVGQFSAGVDTAAGAGLGIAAAIDWEAEALGSGVCP